MITTKKTAVAAVLAAAAIAAPSASAMPIDSHLPATATVPAGVNSGFGPSNGDLASPVVATPVARPSTANGFNWGDAGIGAAAMLSILGAGAGAGILARRSRQGHPVVG